MSYILDALRKSETERRQGKVPDLGHQVQFVHKPKKKPVPAAVWVAVALFLNAVVVGVALWLWLPDQSGEAPASAAPSDAPGQSADGQGATGEPEVPVSPAQESSPSDSAAEEESPTDSRVEPVPVIAPVTDQNTGETVQEIPLIEQPTLIVPSNRQPLPASPETEESEEQSNRRVPHLVELPVSFQRKVPDLTFNSHVYSSDPSSSRVMINGNYLRAGDSFSGIRVETITEGGVELSLEGQRFRVGVVRDWTSPR